MGARGPKGYGEELRIKQRYAVLSDKVFAFYEECLNSKDKADKKWAAEQVAKALVKMIPQDLTTGGKELPTPILAYAIQRNDSDQEDTGSKAKD